MKYITIDAKGRTIARHYTGFRPYHYCVGDFPMVSENTAAHEKGESQYHAELVRENLAQGGRIVWADKVRDWVFND